jgi:hypothetical protein
VLLEASPLFLPSGLKGWERVKDLRDEARGQEKPGFLNLRRKIRKEGWERWKPEMKERERGGGGGFTCVVEKKEWNEKEERGGEGHVCGEEKKPKR